MTGPPVWVAELAERFWLDARTAPPPFPRELEQVLPFVARLVVVRRPRLRVVTVRTHLESKRVPVAALEPDRALRAALYCWRGVGHLFLDADDPPAERRFSLAHEIAHYLRDCLEPRRRIEKALGADSLDVLDGLRPPTDAERLHAVLRNRPLAAHTHFLRRDSAGYPLGDAERRAEAEADRLAFELLAPAECFRHETNAEVVTARLVSEFGLPPQPAREYALHLLPPPPPSSGFLARLAKSL